MSTPSDRFRRVAADFTRVVGAVPDDAWDAPAPPEGWRARDVVGHLAEWFSGLFFATWGDPAPPLPSVEDDPAGTWAALRDAVQAVLDDPDRADVVREIPPGPMTRAEAIDRLGSSDIVMHQWDLARATGGDERLDPAEVHALLAEMEPLDEVLRSSGHYGPRVEVAADADEQTRLIAFIGRQP
ncbi:TIGR03086 family protein [Iamia sp. SCSIO 61187]|uniref:TIGR03086 family metal-binding protein n=1 Tax=Iamia sp. SCSIO 61187 TaxID=2722752 RepID=UPI001C629DDF|nr:TIGR03086 family metal-binding protein [Iamia sp. SCSIO 61187]QYG91138.1 TIGR03086 family protein [Iamia sp. SCSIO 61187]